MLRAIQGDMFELEIKICGIDANLIENVWFSSKRLDITKSISNIGDNYFLRIESIITKKFQVGFADYDITVQLKDGQYLTVLHNECIEILQKQNEVKNDSL